MHWFFSEKEVRKEERLRLAWNDMQIWAISVGKSDSMVLNEHTHIHKYIHTLGLTIKTTLLHMVCILATQVNPTNIKPPNKTPPGGPFQATKYESENIKVLYLGVYKKKYENITK